MLINFEKLKPLLPYINVLALGLGITKLVLFYREFGINIVQYIDFSEALILFLEDILWFILAIFIPFIISMLLFGHKMAEFYTSINKVIVEQPNYWKRLWTFSKYNAGFIIPIIIGFFTGINLGLLILVVTVTYFLLEIKFTLSKRYGIDFDSTYHNLIYWIALVMYFGFGRLQNQISQVRNTNMYEHSKLYMNEGEPILIDRTTIYLGKSKDYFYLYDKKRESAVIIPSSEVSRVDLRNTKKGKLNLFY